MNDDSKDVSEENADWPAAGAAQPAAAPPSTVSPGHLLNRARKSREVSVEELSAQTMLSRATVQALEENDFGRLSQPVFVRGYYRKCAKVLGVPEAEIMDAYAAWTGVEGPKPVSPSYVDVVPEDVTPRSWGVLRVLILLVVAGVLGALAWLVLPTLGGRITAANDNAAPDSRAVTITSAPAADEPVQQDAPAAPPVQATPESEQAMATPPASAPATTEQPAENASAAGGQLRLHFIERSWIDLRDANNKRIISGIVPADTDRIVDEGQPPYSIALGYAPGVEVYVGGQRINLEDKTNADHTARFTVEIKQ